LQRIAFSELLVSYPRCYPAFILPAEVIDSPHSMHVYEVRPRKDYRGVDLISDALPFGRLWYGEPNTISNAVDYAKHRSRSHDAPVSI